MCEELSLWSKAECTPQRHKEAWNRMPPPECCTQCSREGNTTALTELQATVLQILAAFMPDTWSLDMYLSRLILTAISNAFLDSKEQAHCRHTNSSASNTTSWHTLEVSNNTNAWCDLSTRCWVTNTPFAWVTGLLHKDCSVVTISSVQVMRAHTNTSAVQDNVDKLVLLNRSKPIRWNSLCVKFNSVRCLYIESSHTFITTSRTNATTTDTMKSHPTASLKQFLTASPLQAAMDVYKNDDTVPDVIRFSATRTRTYVHPLKAGKDRHEKFAVDASQLALLFLMATIVQCHRVGYCIPCLTQVIQVDAEGLLRHLAALWKWPSSRLLHTSPRHSVINALR